MERNQFNFRAVRSLNATKLGVFLQRTEVFNLETENSGNQFAVAVHIDGTYGRWNLNTEYIYYKYDNAEDIDLMVVKKTGDKREWRFFT